MNKTIYVRDEDVAIWDKARELAGDKLSPVIMDGLKRYVARTEAESKGFERIEVRFEDADDHLIPKAKAFYGRWVMPPEAPLTIEDEDGHVVRRYIVALTPKGRAVFCSWSDEERMGEPYRAKKRFAVFDSLELAAADGSYNWPARKAIEARGLPMEELDI